MTVIMLLFMSRDSSDRFSGALWVIRSQFTVDDVSWMKAMIPHHSIAILTSSLANTSDPQVKNMANRIIEAQKKENDEIKELIEDLSQ